MKRILNNNTVKSLFKAPRGRKYPPPPPPPINSIFRGFILFILLLAGPVTKTIAQSATISISVNSLANFERNDEISGHFVINLSSTQSTVTSFQLCFSSSLSVPSFTVIQGVLMPVRYGQECTTKITILAGHSRSSVQVIGNDDTLDEPDEIVTATISEDPNSPLPDGIVISATASTASVTIRDDDPTIVTLSRTGSSSMVDEGGTVEFTVTLGRSLIAGEIIDVPLIVSGTGITTTDWSLAAKTGDALNTGVTLVNETVVRFSGASAQTATLLLTAAADNTAEAGGPETLILALGPNDETANGFDLNTRMTNVGGGADPDGTDNTVNITINDDMTAPIPAPLTAIERQCSLTETQLNRMIPTATDNQMGTVRVTNNIGKFPIMSDTTITWTYTDPTGNTATQTQEVTIDDTMNPVPNPDNDLTTLTAACSIAIGDITIPTATDNCDGPIMATANVTPPITASTTIMWTYTDAAGNTATQTQEVTIADNIAPNPDSNNDLSEITRQCPLRENELTTPTATDNCTGVVTVTNNVVNFPISSDTTITWTYTDGANNTVTQTQQVTIRDNTNPVPATADLPMLEDCSQITSLIAPTATDNCDGTITATTGITPPITASTTLMWTYRDDAGNTATQTQEVIIGDTEAPVPGKSNLPALTEGCPVAAITDLTAPIATDNCDNGTITATTDASFPITSTTTITWTYTDAAGNTAVQTQEVTCPLSAAEDTAEAVIFPNPSGRYLEVRSSVGGTFQILSLSGKPLLEGTVNTKMDIISLQSGLYLVQLPDGHLLKFVRE